jgi:hypothetical protein
MALHGTPWPVCRSEFVPRTRQTACNYPPLRPLPRRRQPRPQPNRAGPRSPPGGRRPPASHALHALHVLREKHTGVSCRPWAPTTSSRCPGKSPSVSRKQRCSHGIWLEGLIRPVGRPCASCIPFIGVATRPSDLRSMSAGDGFGSPFWTKKPAWTGPLRTGPCRHGHSLIEVRDRSFTRPSAIASDRTDRGRPMRRADFARKGTATPKAGAEPVPFAMGAPDWLEKASGQRLPEPRTPRPDSRLTG